MRAMLSGWWLWAACVVSPDDKIELGDGLTEESDTPRGDTDDTEPISEDTASDELRVRVVENPEVIELGHAQPPIRLQVRGTDLPEVVVWTVTTDLDGEVPPPVWDAASSEFHLTTETWTAGMHQVQLVATTPDGGQGSTTLEVGICAWPPLEDFSTSVVGNGWIVFGDAAWDAGGWLEITGNVQSHAGAIYKIDRRINPGDFRMEFDIATGGGINTGADGYSVNIINAVDLVDLQNIVSASGNGGCLGYGTVAGCSTWGAIDAFHVEFDTWYNSESPMFDPTADNHVAINLNGDPGGHHLWAPVPTLEDLNWRHIIVQIRGSRIQVGLDGQLIMDDVIPGFAFDGGYIGVTGSTGWATNFHRFDNLQLFDWCQVP